MTRRFLSSRKSHLMSQLSASFLAALIAFTPVVPAFAQEVNPSPGDTDSDDISAEKRPSIDFTVTPCETSEKFAVETTEKSAGVPLSAERLEELARRLPPLEKATGKAFLLPEQALVKPPKSGMEVVEKFPPEQSAGAPPKPARDVEKLPLKILRVSPQGDIVTARQVAVTFSQPMVAVQEAGDVDTTPFLKMSPQPAGHWRWAGTQTLVFTPARKDRRLPAATTYRITFPPKLQSQSGSSLSTAPVYTFKTPTLQAIRIIPGPSEPTLATPTIFLQFNQDINKEALLPHIVLRDRSHTYPLRFATASEITDEKKNASKIDAELFPANQWIALKPVSPLPLANRYSLDLQAGSPSAEGPDTPLRDAVDIITVHSPLNLIQSPANGETPERNVFDFTFNNALSLENHKISDLVKIAPVPPNLEVGCFTDLIRISGDFKSFQKYAVTIDGALKDRFGQKLGHPVTRSWTTGARDTVLSCRTGYVTIAPGQKPAISFYAQGTEKVTVKIYKIAVSDWRKVMSKAPALFDNFFVDSISPFGPPIATKIYPVGNDAVSVDVDLKKYLTDGCGQFVVVGSCPNKASKELSKFSAMAQVTGIGVDTFKGKDNKLGIFTSSLIDGKPLTDCSVSLLPAEVTANTDEHGQASISVLKKKDFGSGQVILVTRGSDAVMMPALCEQWMGEPAKPTIDWYGATDRALYRPGDTVHVKGWQRGFKYDENSAIRLFSSGLKNVDYVVMSPDGSKLDSGNAKIDDAGGFDFEFAIPKKINLGDIQIKVSAPQEFLKDFPDNEFQPDAAGSQKPIKDYSTTISVSVEEFRRPEFAMKTTSSKSSMFLGDTAKLTAAASYFGGGDLPETPVLWSVAASSSAFNPPGWSEYNFGGLMSAVPGGASMDRSKNINVTSDSHGTTSVDVRVKSVPQPTPVRLACSATFHDLNRQVWTDQCEVIVHPSKLYVGVKAAQVNDKLEGSVIVTDCDGKAVKGTNVDLNFRKSNIDNELVSFHKLNLVSGDKPTNFSLTLPSSQSIEITAMVKDDHGMPNQTVSQIWIDTSKETLAGQSRENEARALTLSADKQTYTAGDTANIAIKSNLYPAQGLLLLSRNSLVRTVPLELKGESTTVAVPLTADDYPELMIEALVNGADYAFANGQLKLSIPASTKKLSLSVKPEQEAIAPGSDTRLNVALLDSSGHAVSGGHVAIAVVDESVFALKEYKWPDILDAFYPSSAQASLREFLRKTIVLKKSDGSQNISDAQFQTIDRGIAPVAAPQPAVASYLPGGGGGGGSNVQYYEAAKPSGAAELEAPAPRFAKRKGGLVAAAVDPAFGQKNEVLDEGSNQKPFAVRTNFSELALFAPDVVTDTNGTASVKFHLPDSTTKYRIMAAAVAGSDNFGIAESTLSTRMDLAIKPSLPRFLNFGDHCELPFVIQNQTDKPFKTDLILRVRNAVIEDPAAKLAGADADETALDGRSVEVPANGRVEVRFPITTKSLGTIDIQCTGVADKFSDAANVSVPVILPATVETFAAYGQIDKGAATQKLSLPKDILPEVGGLTITTSSTAMQALADAYFYLRDYKFDCSEQLSSQLLAMLSLHDALAAFGKLDAHGEETFRANVLNTIKILDSRRSALGGFGLWKQEDRPAYPYVSLQVSRALYIAKSKGYDVSDECLASCKKYLKEIDKHIDRDEPASVRAAIQAYALNVRALEGDVDTAAARKTIALAGVNLNVEESAWLLPVLSKESQKCATELAKVRALINNSIVETASTASTTGRDYGAFCYRLFYSDTRQDALVLSALIADQPQSELIPKLAKGLLARRRNGAWNGTQENWVALEALDKYFSTYEKTTPNFTANEWLGNTFAGSHKYSGRSVESHNIEIPTEYLIKHEHTSDDITISKDGPGRLYYRVGLDYAPTSLQLKSKVAGFVIEKNYEGIDNKNDVTRDADGIWHFKAGASVRCKVHFSAEGARYHVALMSPLPGGCEAVNSLLAGNKETDDDVPSMSDLGGFHSLWWRQWYDHKNVRDHQVEAFGSVVYAGEQDFDFIMRATTPGHFNVPPTKIEEMYQSETFGRTASDTVVIE